MHWQRRCRNICKILLWFSWWRNYQWSTSGTTFSGAIRISTRANPPELLVQTVPFAANCSSCGSSVQWSLIIAQPGMALHLLQHGNYTGWKYRLFWPHKTHRYNSSSPARCRADSWFPPSQWETALLCNDVSHWLGASLKSAPEMSGFLLYLGEILLRYNGTQLYHPGSFCVCAQPMRDGVTV